MLLWGLNSRKQQLWLLFGILLLLAAVGVVAADQAILRDSRILPNVFVAYMVWPSADTENRLMFTILVAVIFSWILAYHQHDDSQ